MQTIVIYAVSFLLAILPLLMAAFFLLFTKPRKLFEIQSDLQQLRTGVVVGAAQQLKYRGGRGSQSGEKMGAPLEGSLDGKTVDDEDEVTKLINEYLSTFTLLAPAIILTLLYLAAFLLCDSHVLYVFDKRGLTFFSAAFVTNARLALYAFLGVYLFNLGTMLRRIYLADMNEQVFWGAINRLLLSTGLAIVLMQENLPLNTKQPLLFFSVGFIANILLQWMLEQVLKLLNAAKPKRDDLSLQMVKGINLWKEYRLEEEGIESVQNLATANLVELAVRTHYNARTLIDWIDQSIILSRFSIDQIKTMSDQGVSISAIDLAASSPSYRGSTDISDELASRLQISPLLLANTLNSLFEDRYLRELWFTWQSNQDAELRSKTEVADGQWGQSEASPD